MKDITLANVVIEIANNLHAKISGMSATSDAVMQYIQAYRQRRADRITHAIHSGASIVFRTPLLIDDQYPVGVSLGYHAVGDEEVYIYRYEVSYDIPTPANRPERKKLINVRHVTDSTEFEKTLTLSKTHMKMRGGGYGLTRREWDAIEDPAFALHRALKYLPENNEGDRFSSLVAEAAMTQYNLLTPYLDSPNV